MKNVFVKAGFKIDAFSTSKIIFDDSDLVSMNVKCRVNNIFSETTLLFTFSKFNDLLRFSGAVGEIVQLKVSDKLLSNEEQPYVIDLSNENSGMYMIRFIAIDGNSSDHKVILIK